MRTEIFNPAHGDRPHVENVAVLITDGEPTREFDKLYDEVRDIKNRDIDIIGVGVTQRVGLNAHTANNNVRCGQNWSDPSRVM